MFPGARVIINKVFEKCLDERVNVRKAALQVISSLFKFSSKWMTSEALAVCFVIVLIEFQIYDQSIYFI